MNSRILVNWNILGQDPDGPSKEFDSWLDAAHFLLREFSWLIAEDAQLSHDAQLAAKTIQDQLGSPGYPPTSMSYSVGSFVYWIEKQKLETVE